MRSHPLVTLVISLALICTPPWSAALTAGKVRGSVWIGQPLDISIAVEPDTDQSSSELCPHADVYYGDTPQDGSQVRVSLDNVAPGDNPSLRIRSAGKVNEPIITVNLRLGCVQKTAHRVVVLADYPGTGTGTGTGAFTPENTPTPPPPATPPPPRPGPKGVAPSADSDGIELTLASNLSLDSKSRYLSPKKKKSRKHRSTEKDDAKPRGTPQRATGTARADTGASGKVTKPRLKLDPVEQITERVGALEAERSASAASAESAPGSAPVSAEAQRLNALQQELQRLVEQASQNERTMTALRERLEHQEPNRGPALLAYGLLSLLALALVTTLALAARHMRRSRRAALADEDDLP